MPKKKLKELPKAYGAAAIYPYSDALMELGVRTDRFGEEYQLFRIVGSGDKRRIWVPRKMAVFHGDNLVRAGLPAQFVSKFKPRHAEQERVVAECVMHLKNGENFMAECPTGFGKSQTAGTLVIMGDGTLKSVENVKNGDVLIGPDSKPRTVSGTLKHWSPIYRITPTKGEPFECNDVHILPLKCTSDMKRSTKYRKGEITCIEVKDYIKQSKTFKHMMKLWRAPGIDLPERKVFDPYIVGLYLADGTKDSSTPELSCGLVKLPALGYVESVTEVSSKVFKHGAWYYRIPSLKSIQELSVKTGSRHIHDRYLRNSRENRLQLLAGLLDGDGHLVKNTVFELACKDESFKDEVLFLCRSLGFAAYAKISTKGIKATGFTGQYWVITISGDTDQIPTKIPSKQAQPRKQKKDHLVTGFTVEYVRDDWVYGFQLDGDHLYLLKDFTVSHNTACSMDIIAKIGKKTLVVVTKEDLRDQWIEAATKFLGLSMKDIGLIQGDTFQVSGKKLVIAMIQSLAKEDRYPVAPFNEFGLAIWDECFHPSHDLLTSRGWVPVADIKSDDLVAQVDPVTKEVSFAAPEKLIAKDFTGSLVSIAGQKMDLLATPSHQHLTYWDGEEPRKIEFKDFSPGSRGHTLYAPTPYGEQALTVEEKLAVAFQADGHRVRQRSDGKWYVKFGFRRERKIARMESLLSESHYEWSKRVNGRGDTVFRVWLDWCPSKDLATWVIPTRIGGWYVAFLDEIAEWDGWRTDKGIHYESDKENCEIVQMAAVLAGRIATVLSVRNRYRVNMWESALRSSRSLVKGAVPYTGPVYCVRMPHGTVITRRNGKVCVTGNCHRVAADYFSQSCFRVPAAMRLGLSATPDRKDGREEVLFSHIGRVLVKSEAAPMIPRVIVRRSPWKVPLVRSKKKDGSVKLEPMPHSPGKCGHIINMLCNYHPRNEMLANFTAAAYKKGRTILVQSDRKEHLETLAMMFQKLGIPPAHMGYYVGGMKAADLDNTKTKRIILATYQMTAEGTDIPWLDTLVMATPKSDVRQIVGRIIRQYEGKQEPVVFDLVDASSNVFAGYWNSRRQWYGSIDAPLDLGKPAH